MIRHCSSKKFALTKCRSPTLDRSSLRYRSGRRRQARLNIAIYSVKDKVEILTVRRGSQLLDVSEIDDEHE